MRSTSGPSREPSTKRDRRPVIQLKLPYVAVMLVALSLLLYAYKEHLAAWWRLPYQSIADILLTSAIVALTFEWFLRRENEAHLTDIVRRTVHEELGPLARSFFSEPQVLLKALGKPALDQVINTALGIRLEDPTLAAEVDSGLLQAIAKYKERWNDARFTVTLTRVQDDPSREVRDRYFQAYVGLRLEMVLTRSEFPVWCVSSKEAYDDVLWGDQDFFYAWLQPPTREFPEVSESSFEVEGIAVNGTRLGICTTKNLDPRRMLVVCRDDFLEPLQGQQVIVEATFRVKVPKRAHSLNLSVVAPTRGVLMALFYGDTDVHRVEVTDMFVSSRRPEIRELPTSTRPRAIEVQLREWAFPKGGVVFNWHLEQEQTQHFDELLGNPGGA
jgi:hypothetical protein